MTVSASEIKGLFAQLVSLVGGVEAAGAYLAISHQRVSQLQITSAPDMPTLMQVARLEEACGQPVVTAALARVAVGESLTRDPEKEIGDVVIQTAEVLHLHRSGAPLKERKAASLRLVEEARQVADSYGTN